MRQNKREMGLLVMAVLALTACGADSEPKDGCAENSDCPAQTACVSGECVALDAIGGDTTPDALPDADVQIDTISDIPILTDADADAEEDQSETTEGTFGAPCEENSDCESNYCVEGQETRVCTETCATTCPDPEWECRLVQGGLGDSINLCFPPVDYLCRTCGSDADCGGLENFCLEQIDGRFGCARDCSSESCPEGYVCQSVTRDSGAGPREYQQCLPALGVCSGCLDLDGDLYGTGPTCLGEDCNDDDINSYPGAAELCDNEDNDCNRVVDNGFDVLTDRDNCGVCGNICLPPRGTGECLGGVCDVATCDVGYYDIDGDFINGCEYACIRSNGGVEICDLRDNDCDGAIDDGIDLESDPDNCGRCSNQCIAIRGEGSCYQGDCEVSDCDSGYWDLDGEFLNGCEYACTISNGNVEACDEVDNDCDGLIDEGFDLNFDDSNCGECGNACDPFGGTGDCSGSLCRILSCDAGHYDLDLSYATGCEYACTVSNGGTEVCDRADNDCNGQIDEGLRLDRDPLNCGDCGVICAPEQGVGGCLDSECNVATCNPGYYDVDLEYANGCEYECEPTADGVEACDTVDNDCDALIDEDFELATNPLNCGECGNACVVPGGRADCAEGDCYIVQCPTNTYDIDRNFDNGCEYVCRPTSLSESCDGVDNNCDGNIDEGFDTTSDANNCGECGAVCDLSNAVEACVDSECVVTDCVGAFDNCNGLDADGCESDLRRDASNCNECGNVCEGLNAEWSCSFGACVPSRCTGSFRDCNLLPEDGCETDILTDNDHCNFCNAPCDLLNGASECNGGICELIECQAGFGDCDSDQFSGCETRTVDNSLHCGRCFNRCSTPGASTYCDVDTCRISNCSAGTGDCNADVSDACETNVTNSPDHCGRCGRACIGANIEDGICVSGNCVVDACDFGYDDCDARFDTGCEQDILFSNDHCGGCGIECNPIGAVGSCQSGECQWDACLPGYIDLDGLATNGCEYSCTPSSTTDAPDLGFVDANCDGIDGNVASAVFVAPAPVGSPTGAGTRSSPLSSVSTAITLAQSQSKTQVLLAVGQYAESVTMRSGISIYGGYQPASNWSRAAVGTATSTVGATSTGVRAIGISSATTLQNVRVISENATTAGQSSIALYVSTSSSALVIEGNQFQAGAGAAGSAGNNGGQGEAGGNGATGFSGNSGGGGGQGGSSDCLGFGGNGGAGSAGGRGENGSSGVGTSEGGGGAGGGDGGGTCIIICVSPSGANEGIGGSEGGAGSTGGNGSGGNSTGTIAGGLWLGGAGASGSRGSAGTGGGGGGAGGGFDCCDEDRGGGGGGGGGAGCGGFGGNGGAGGGGSFGIFLFDSSPLITLSNIRSGNAGAGGAGGVGGPGGSGGSGGAGGGGEGSAASGGRGGDGGDGGSGGCGGGGAGGISWSVYRAGIANPNLVNNTVGNGAAGPGGSGACGAANGATGSSGGYF